MNVIRVLRGAALIRIGIGATMALYTRPLLKAMLPKADPSSSFVLFARTLGIRDAFFGLGGLLASMDGKETEEARRWVQLWLANEIADVIVGLSMTRELGLQGAATAAAAPLPLIAADAWVLRHLG